MSDTEKESMGAHIGKLVLASAVTFMVWKALQYAFGHKIDSHIEKRAARKA